MRGDHIIKIAIADVFDDIYDSGSFWRRQLHQFLAGLRIALRRRLLNNTLYEGCATGELGAPALRRSVHSRYGTADVVTGTAVNGSTFSPRSPSR